MRQFIALEVSERDRITSFVDKYKHLVPRATWTPEDKLHITLRFFTSPRPADEIQHLMDDAARDTAPFQMHLNGMNTFGNRVLYAVPAPVVELVNLGRKVGTKSFRPHVTLAKLEERNDTAPEFSELVQQHGVLCLGVMQANTITLYRTQGSGKPYEALYSATLHGEPEPVYF